MQRREFITLVGGVATSWPLGARAQQGERTRRVGVLMCTAVTIRKDRPVSRRFTRRYSNWAGPAAATCGSTIRWGAGNPDDVAQIRGGTCRARAGRHSGHGQFRHGRRVCRQPSVPIVFTNVPDPVGAGFVESLARPGGNVTGFLLFEYGMSGKWLELLKEVAPGVTRVAVLRDPALPAGIGQLGAIQAVAPSLRIEVSAVNVRDTSEIEHAVAAFARAANSGLIVTQSALATIHRELIVTLAARHRLPAVYNSRIFVTAGGLVSYGDDLANQDRLAAGYVDRILKGAKPADLPVQAPTKFELAINMKTAKVLGLAVPPTLLATADEVIE